MQFIAAGEPAGGDRAAVFDLRQHRGERLPSHRVDTGNPALGLERPGRRRREFFPVDHAGGTQNFQMIGCFGAPRRSGHVVSEPREDRNRDAAEPAVRASDQNFTLIRRQARLLQRHDRKHGREPRGPDGHRLARGKIVGERDKPVGVHARALGKAAPVQLADAPAGQDHGVTRRVSVGR